MSQGNIGQVFAWSLGVCIFHKYTTGNSDAGDPLSLQTEALWLFSVPLAWSSRCGIHCMLLPSFCCLSSLFNRFHYTEKHVLPPQTGGQKGPMVGLLGRRPIPALPQLTVPSFRVSGRHLGSAGWGCQCNLELGRVFFWARLSIPYGKQICCLILGPSLHQEESGELNSKWRAVLQFGRISMVHSRPRACAAPESAVQDQAGLWLGLQFYVNLSCPISPLPVLPFRSCLLTSSWRLATKSVRVIVQVAFSRSLTKTWVEKKAVQSYPHALSSIEHFPLKFREVGACSTEPSVSQGVPNNHSLHQEAEFLRPLMRCPLLSFFLVLLIELVRWKFLWHLNKEMVYWTRPREEKMSISLCNLLIAGNELRGFLCIIILICKIRWRNVLLWFCSRGPKTTKVSPSREEVCL